MAGFFEGLSVRPGLSPTRLYLRLLLTLPLLCGTAGMIGASAIGAWRAWATGSAGFVRSAEAAAGIAAICLVLALPAAARGLRARWLLPLWAGPQVGAIGWALLPAPRSFWFEIAGGAALLLPVMTVFLAAFWQNPPSGLASIAAASGASPSRKLLMAFRPGLPAGAVGLLLVFGLALGLFPLLAAFCSRP